MSNADANANADAGVTAIALPVLSYRRAKNKGADQLRNYCEANQRFCFHYTDSTIPLLSKSKTIFCDCTAQFVSDLVGTQIVGVAILFNKNVDFKIHKSFSDPEGNYLICDLSVADNKFTLINLYGPNKDTPTFFQNIINISETIGNENLIICGDFNTIQDEKLDYYNYKNINNKMSHKKILEIKENYKLYDPFREAYPSLKRYTWRKKSPLKQSALITF